jgi:hypothetical protein
MNQDRADAISLIWLPFAATDIACFAQTDPAIKQDTADPKWGAAGTIGGYTTHIYSLAFGAAALDATGDCEVDGLTLTARLGRSLAASLSQARSRGV